MVNKLYSSVTGTASLDVREPGVITGITISWQTPAAATVKIEVSFNSTAQFAVNDSTGILAAMNGPSAMGASGHLTIPMNELVDAGERLYLHTEGSPVISVVIYTQTAGTAARVPARRR